MKYCPQRREVSSILWTHKFFPNQVGGNIPVFMGFHHNKQLKHKYVLKKEVLKPTLSAQVPFNIYIYIHIYIYTYISPPPIPCSLFEGAGGSREPRACETSSGAAQAMSPPRCPRSKSSSGKLRFWTSRAREAMAFGHRAADGK